MLSIMNKFAVIQTGGKQYKVSEGDLISVEKIKGEYKLGDKISFDKVLLIDDGKEIKIGDPYIKDAKADAILEKEGKGKKVVVIKYKAKSRYFKKRGHRQPYFKVRIKSIK